MAIADHKSSSSSSSDGKVRGFFKRLFRPSGNATTTTSSSSMLQSNDDGSIPHASSSVSSVAKSLLPTRHRLKLDPCNKLYFPYVCRHVGLKEELLTYDFGVGLKEELQRTNLECSLGFYCGCKSVTVMIDL